MKLQLIIAGFFLAVAGVIWFAFLRPIPVRQTAGTIDSKTWTPSGEYLQYPVGMRAGFRTPTRVPLAEHYVLGIRVDGESGELRYAANTTAAAQLEVGERVTVWYIERGVSPFWRRVYVTDVKRAD